MPSGDFANEPGGDGHVAALPDDTHAAVDRHADKQVVQRTASSTVYDNGDGTSTLVGRAGPANWNDRGVWRQIDPTLRRRADGDWENASGPVAVNIASASGGRDLVKASGEGWSIGWRMEAAANGRAAVVDGPTARYAAISEGVSLNARVGLDAVKETITLDAPLRPGVPSKFRFPLSLDGVAAAQDGGSIVFTTPDGRTVAEMPPGTAHDADGLAASGVDTTAPVEVRLVGRVVEVSVDRAWLDDPGRVYPVSIDPSINFRAGRDSTSDDAFGSSASPNTNFGDFDDGTGDEFVTGKIDRVGWRTSTDENIAFFKYDLLPLQGHAIVSGHWYGYFLTTNSYANNAFRICRVTGVWTGPTLTWNNKPGRDTSACALGNTIGPEEWVARDISGWMQGWANDQASNQGIGVDSPVDATRCGTGKCYFRVASDHSYDYDSDPYIEVVFQNAQPPAPSGLQPPSGTVTTSSTPTLSVPAVADPEGDAVRYWFRIASGTDGESGQVVNSGWTTSTSFTLPPGALQDGVTYYWKAITWDGWGPNHSYSAPVSLKLNRRLGDGGPSPTDSVGPVTVNLATGNVTHTHNSPTFATVGGPVGVSLSYNSQGGEGGLTGTYYRDCESWDPFATLPALARTDPAVDFVWASSPAPGLVGDENYCVRWEGLISVPISNNYCFDAAHDDGIRVTVNNVVVVDRWFDGTSEPANGRGCVDLFTNRTVPIRVDYYNHLGPGKARLWVRSTMTGSLYVPASWLSTTPKTMPAGWSLSAGAQGLAYSRAVVGADTVTLKSADGESYEYRRTSSGSWSPQPGEDAVLTTSSEPDGRPTYVVHAEDGLTYTFDGVGTLIRAQAAVDDLRPAAASYAFDSAGRVASITDPVTGKQITLDYSYPATAPGNCPPSPSGFDQFAPSGHLCEVNYWDGSQTRLYYLGGRLSRVVEPGGATTDFGYDGVGRLSAIRDPLANDQLSTNPPMRANDSSVLTEVGYDGAGRATAVTLPAPAAGAPRPAHSYAYAAADETRVHVAGVSPPIGFSRAAKFNGAGQVTRETDASGVVADSLWDAGDRLLERTAAATDAGLSLKTATVYDHAGRPTHAYGPARPSCFTGQTPNGTCPSVPLAQTAYDEGIAGLAAAYWDNASHTGAARRHGTGVGDATGAVDRDWALSAPVDQPVGFPPDGWSARLTGEVLLPAAGTYAFRLQPGDTGDKGRLYVDDQLVVDAWAGGAAWSSSGSVTAAEPNTRRRIRVDFADVTGAASLQLRWTPPGEADAVVPGASLAPRYGLVTSTVDPDLKRHANEYATGPIGPEFGLETASIEDPAGLNLRTTTAYEDPASPTGYLRRTQRALPKGSATATAYQYYAPGEQATNICNGQAVTGMLKSDTGPAPATGERIVRLYVYDAAHRVVGTKVASDPDAKWRCTAYDTRGRVVSERDAAGVETVTSYSPPGTVAAAFADSSGAPRSTEAVADLLGQQVSYRDEHGTATRAVYDQAMRAVASYRHFAGASEAALMQWGYATDGRLQSVTDLSSGSARTVTLGYDAAGRPTTSQRPNGVTTTTAYDAAHGRVASMSHSTGGAWSVTRSTGGRVATDATPSRTRSLTYDGAGRLTRASDSGGAVRDYAYDADSNRCAQATTCSTPTYAYDDADRLTASPFATSYTYDNHGNLVSAVRPQAAPQTVSDSWPFDWGAGRDVPITLAQAGTVSAGLDWTPTPVAQTAAPVTGTVAAGATATGAEAVVSLSDYNPTLTWSKDNHEGTVTQFPSFTAAGEKWYAINTAGPGRIFGELGWNNVYAPYSNGAARGLGWQQSSDPLRPGFFYDTASIVMTGPGTARITVTPGANNFPPGVPVDIDVQALWADGSVADESKTLGSGPETVEFPSGISDFQPAPKSFHLRLWSPTQPEWSAAGSYPVTPRVELELWNGTKTTRLATGTGADLARRAFTYNPSGGAPAGAYQFRVASLDSYSVSGRLTQTYQRADWAELQLTATDSSGAVVLDRTSSTGSITADALAGPAGPVTWTVRNQSADLAAPFTLSQRTVTLLSVNPHAVGVATSLPTDSLVTNEAVGYVSASLAWTPNPLSPENLCVAVKNAAKTELARKCGTSGQLEAVTRRNATGTRYASFWTTGGTPVAVTGSAVTPATRPVSGTVELRNSSGAVVASNSGTAKPVTLNAANVPAGSYTLRSTLSYSGSATLTGTHPPRPNLESISYDGNDHATIVDNGSQTVRETLAPSGRVLRREVVDSYTGVKSEDSVYGYDGPGDSPSYSRPYSVSVPSTTPVTTYVIGPDGLLLIDNAGAAQWQLQNVHGDVIGKADGTGLVTLNPDVDEFGVGDAPDSRLGWLGGKQRYSLDRDLGIQRMGVRLYQPNIGRFLSVDPVEGGSANDYDYANADPANQFDLDGLSAGGCGSNLECRRRTELRARGRAQCSKGYVFNRRGQCVPIRRLKICGGGVSTGLAAAGASTLVKKAGGWGVLLDTVREFGCYMDATYADIGYESRGPLIRQARAA